MRLGVDVGATGVKLALIGVDNDGLPHVVRRNVLEQLQTARHGDELVELLRLQIASLAGSDRDALTAVGVGVAGVLDTDTGTILESPNIPWLSGYPLAASLAAALDLRVEMDNDANCICLGEANAGAGRGFDNLACLALGTGVGGGLILSRRLHRGDRGRAAEIGHLCVDPFGPPCGCGGRGCLEQYASQTGLFAMMKRAGLVDSSEHVAKDCIVRLFDQAESGDLRSLALVRSAGAALGEVVANLATVLPLSVVVVAGGIANRLDALRPALEATLEQRLGNAAQAVIEVRAGQLGNDAGCLGAVALLEQDEPLTGSRRIPSSS